VGIAFTVGIGMVLAVHGHPPDWITLQGERSENRQQVFDRFDEAQAAVRQGAMEAERDP
jgi:hypothetical protein